MISKRWIILLMDLIRVCGHLVLLCFRFCLILRGIIRLLILLRKLVGLLLIWCLNQLLGFLG